MAQNYRMNMRIFFIALLFSFITAGAFPRFAMAKDADDSDTPKKESIPRVDISAGDKSCQKDSECEVVQNQCSCSCGDSVNKDHVKKYSDQIAKLCDHYSGKLCRMKCEGQAKCIDNQCIYARTYN